MPGDLIGGGHRPFPVELEDQVLHLARVRGGHADQINGRTRPPADQFLQRRDGDIKLITRQLNDLLVLVWQRLEAKARVWHGVDLSPQGVE